MLFYLFLVEHRLRYKQYDNVYKRNLSVSDQYDIYREEVFTCRDCDPFLLEPLTGMAHFIHSKKFST